MGIRLWRTRSSVVADERVEAAPEPTIEAPSVTPPKRGGLPVTNEPSVTSSIVEPAISPAPTRPTQKTYELGDWTQLHSAIDECQNCELAQSCSRKVPGKGAQQAGLMIIGEAPGHEEDRQGKPFVGRAGQLLDRMLEAIEIDPASVYITNILKCRPPNNRDPKPDEVVACSQFLQAQIRLVKPRVIFSVGRISAQNLLHNQTPVGRLRGQSMTLPGTDIPLRVTYHPAYLLRNPGEKAKAWEDLKALRRLLNDSV